MTEIATFNEKDKCLSYQTANATQDGMDFIDPYDVDVCNNHIKNLKAHIAHLEQIIDDLHCAVSCQKACFDNIFPGLFDVESSCESTMRMMREAEKVFNDVDKQVKEKDLNY